MQLSRAVERSGTKKSVSLDLMSEYSFGDVLELLRRRVQNLKERNLDEFFTGLLNKRVGQAVVKLSGLKLSQSVGELKEKDLKQMAGIIKDMRFAVTGTTGFINSQVTAGGLSTENFDCATMMSKLDHGLFCIGEMLDIDGDCGGFNLHWCWSSAMCAADAITALYGDEK